MKYADISYLLKSKEAVQFMKKYNFVHYQQEQIHYLFKKCLFIEIFAMEVENVIYIDFYSNEATASSNIDVLLSNFSKAEKNKVILNYKHSPIEYSQEDKSQGFKNARLTRERKFFIYLQLITKFFEPILQCKDFRNFDFEESFDVHKNRVLSAKQEYLKTKKSRFLLGDDIL
ncbi:hypothetical protein GCM10009117_25770 [Gangjinia marincola]|uniref:Uncharacterized protein n=1 Tax=Gangjinia marincola TaxID=578463 RepID=A0ABP3XVV6_9FLAO